MHDARRSVAGAPRLARAGPAAGRAAGAAGARRLLSQQPRPTPRWGLGDAVAGFAIGLSLSSIIASIWLSAHSPAKDVSAGGQALAQLGLWTGLFGCVLWASRRKGAGTLAEDFGFRFRPVDVPIGIAAGVASQWLLLPAIGLLMSPIVGHPKVGGPTQKLVDQAHGFGLVVFVLFVTVGAPLVEELFFRGLVMRSLERRLGIVAAVVITSILFGLAHPQDLPVGALSLVMVSLAAFAAVLCLLAVRTGRLGPAIIAHATFNAWTVFFLLK